jgi:AcrR family transcriptional regulator
VVATSVVAGDKPEPVRRLPRAQRREQILAAATEAFARSGFAATGLDDIATEAGVTRVILYRHFDSKTELYQAVLDRMCARLDAHVEEPVAWLDAGQPDQARAAARVRQAVMGVIGAAVTSEVDCSLPLPAQIEGRS